MSTHSKVLQKENGKIINDLTWKVAGEAGQGILNAGLHMFAKTCLRSGLNVFACAEYPSLIRGGHNNLDVRVSGVDIYSHKKEVDLLVALNKDSIIKHKNKLSHGGGIIYDSDEIEDVGEVKKDIRLYPIPLFTISKECGGKIMSNTVAIGASMALLDFHIDTLSEVIKDNFGKKGDEVVQNNIKAAKAGYDYVKKNFKDDFRFRLEKIGGRGKIFVSGNEAIAIGAVKAGCKFLAAYPMTPATSVMTNMAALERQYNLVVKHTEDEIAAVNMIIGAAHAGVRAMTCTSGGGFALMVEGLGLAAQTETPLVVVESQRPGPGTGMATHSGQGDLKFVLNASTDEFPRIVVAPGDIGDCFYLTIDAFNIAEKYQLPVIILTDKFLGESFHSVKEFDTSKVKIERGKLADKIGNDFSRYVITKDGVSPRSIPGQKNGHFIASSYEHDEEGFESEEEEMRVAMHDKRFRKMQNLKNELVMYKLSGDGNADVTLIGWGSTKGPIKEAMKLLKAGGKKVAYLQIIYASPFPSDEVSSIIKNAKKAVMVENNKTSLMSSLVREHTGIDIDYKILKYDGRAFSPEDIAKGVDMILDNAKIKEVVVNGIKDSNPQRAVFEAYGE